MNTILAIGIIFSIFQTDHNPHRNTETVDQLIAWEQSQTQEDNR